MGIHDRDYYRDESGGLFDSWSRIGVTVWLIVITCVVFVADFLTRDLKNPVILEAGIYHPRLVAAGEVWRLLTPVFLHAGLLHIAFNMLILYWAGSRMEEHYGGREFLAFYLCSGVFASAVYFVLQVTNVMPEAAAIGASGAVTAVLVLFACHYPRQQVLLFFVIPMPIWLLVVIYVALDALGALGGGVGARQNIAYAVHLGGAFFGFAYYRLGMRITSWLPGRSARPARRAAPKLRVVNPEPEELSAPEPVGAAVEAPKRPAEAADEHLEAKVDAVLEKVSKFGQESLTPEERAILFRASEVYKKRRK